MGEGRRRRGRLKYWIFIRIEDICYQNGERNTQKRFDFDFDFDEGSLRRPWLKFSPTALRLHLCDTGSVSVYQSECAKVKADYQRRAAVGRGRSRRRRKKRRRHLSVVGAEVLGLVGYRSYL